MKTLMAALLATAGLYTPGSTFKVITAAAALDTGTFKPDSTFDDPGYCIEYGKKVSNFADQSGPEQFGHLTLFTALEHSVNSVFCKIGMALKAKVILGYAKRFGFYSLPPLETPAGERTASGLWQHGKLFFPKHNYQVDNGRLGFGQEHRLFDVVGHIDDRSSSGFPEAQELVAQILACQLVE